jgi:pimeloyl-ACP methyl ester carboxylesterase
MEQQINFCKTNDGVRIAYATVGEGPPLIKAANWLSHLEYDWRSPVWRHMLAEFARDHAFIRYDERGNGLSDWNVPDLSFEAFVHDLEAVIEAGPQGSFENAAFRIHRRQRPVAPFPAGSARRLSPEPSEHHHHL